MTCWFASTYPFPKSIQRINTRIETPITAGTKIAATLSTRAEILSFPELASSTILTIWCKVVFSLTAVTLTFKAPCWLIVAMLTLSPVFLSTGRDSPVSIDSSTEEFPSSMIPSAEKLSPGLTRSRSFSLISEASFLTSFPSSKTVASFGARLRRAWIAFVVFPLLYFSRYFPIAIRVGTIPAVSKERFIEVIITWWNSSW